MEFLKIESLAELGLIVKLTAFCTTAPIEGSKLQIGDLKVNVKTTYFMCSSTVVSLPDKIRINRPIPLVNSTLIKFRDYL